MKAPEIDLEELERWKEKNFQERLEFLDWYADWMKKHPDWSKRQKNLG